MQVLIFDADPERLERAIVAFLEAGLQVMGSDSLTVAGICLRRGLMDVLVLHKGSLGRAAEDVIRMAERRNPNLATILLSDDVARDTDQLSGQYRSLHCVLGEDVRPSVTARLLVSSFGGDADGIGQGTPALGLCQIAPAQPVFHSRRAA